MTTEKSNINPLAKTPSGIVGLDEILNGGLPRGRPTLVCGGAGCGKTLLAMEFLVRGITQYDDPGVFMAFEENEAELSQNVASLGFDLEELKTQQKLAVDFVRVERQEIEENGEYDLEGLFIRLGYAIDQLGAKRVVLDTIEALFSGLSNMAIVRAELRRLFRWLKDKGVTAIITAEQGEGRLTRHGLEEYVSDCVILLDHRVVDAVSTRRLRVVKYRGTTHGTNEYPFLIDEDGIAVMPITSLGLNHQVGLERVQSGIQGLDDMFAGGGIYRGSSMMISGTAGCGKSSIVAHYVNAACQRGERCLLFAFEESAAQICRNMLSIGIDLGIWINRGLLTIQAERVTIFGLERHLLKFLRNVDEFQPRLVVTDPISSMLGGGGAHDANSMVIRLIDFLKSRGVTSIMTNLTAGGAALEKTRLDVSSLIDTWLLLRDVEAGGERNRIMYVLKSRGMAHSNQLREFLITNDGVRLRDVYVGPAGVLTGSMRTIQEARDQALLVQQRDAIERLRSELRHKQELLKAQIATLQNQHASEALDLEKRIEQELLRDEAGGQVRQALADRRGASL